VDINKSKERQGLESGEDSPISRAKHPDFILDSSGWRQDWDEQVPPVAASAHDHGPK
jgi:hypothetical protein